MNTQPERLNVLFLCQHNAARSLMAEAILNYLGRARFRAFSAGSNPRPDESPNPLAMQVLIGAGIPTAGLHSKSWDIFTAPDTPHMDLVITVCDDAAGEVCPVWPGHPAVAHWAYADPAQLPKSEQLEALRKTLHALKRRIELFISLPPAKLQRALLGSSARELADE